MILQCLNQDLKEHSWIKYATERFNRETNSSNIYRKDIHSISYPDVGSSKCVLYMYGPSLCFDIDP
jgi:hypothetical protein